MGSLTPMLTVGLTGGIGSGKSTVSTRLAELGAVVIDADVIAREVVQPGTEGLTAVARRFGAHVVTPDGALDRGALGRVVFGDEQARRDLEAILHPRIAARTRDLMAVAPAEAVVVHDVPLLVEKQMGPAYHLVVVVGADEQTRLDRLVRDRGMSAQEARARIAAQTTDDERRAAADVWLANDGPRAALAAAVDTLWTQRLAPYNANLAAGRPARRRTVAQQDTAYDAGDADHGRITARLTKRVRHVFGDVVRQVAERPPTDPGDAAVVELRVDVGSVDALAGPELARRIAVGGFVPVSEARAGTVGGGVVRYLGCDPGVLARLYVMGAGPIEAGQPEAELAP